MRFLFTVAWRSLWRQRRRTLLTVSAMAIAAALCMSTICLNDGMFSQIFSIMVEQQLGHVQIHHPDYPTKRILYDTIENAEATLVELDSMDETVAASPRLFGFALLGSDTKTLGAQLVGIDPDRERAVTPVADRLIRGTYLTAESSLRILVGEGLAESLDVDVGDTLVAVTQASDGSLGNELFQIDGIFRTGQVALDRSGTFVRLQDLQALLVFDDQVHEISLLTHSPDQIGSYAQAVREHVDPTLAVAPWWEVAPEAKSMLDMQTLSRTIVLGIVFTIAAFGVINTMMMSVFERTREFGVLKALGIRPARLVALVMVESLLIGLLATCAAAVIGGFLDWYLIVHGLDFSASIDEGVSFAGVQIDPVIHGEFRLDSIVWTLSSLVLVAIAAAIWPAARAARLNPVEAIRSE